MRERLRVLRRRVAHALLVGPRAFVARHLSAALSAVRAAVGSCRRRGSLKVKLVLALTALASGILLLTYATLMFGVHRAAAGEAERRAVELLGYFSGAVAEAVAAEDRMQVHLVSQAIVKHGVPGLAIVSSSGSVLYASEPALEEKARRAPGDLVPSGGGLVGTVEADGAMLLHAARRVVFGKSPVGVIHIWLNLSELEERMFEPYRFVYPIFAVGFCCMLALATGALTLPFRALKRVTLVAERIGSGDLTSRVPVYGRDEVAAFCRVFNKMVGSLGRARAEIARQHIEMIRTMISVVEAKDPYTRGHCLRVQSLTIRLLEGVENIAPDVKARIETTALLHDIGKIGIPDNILMKKGKLTEEQVAVLRSHVLVGERILQHHDSLREVSRWVRHHHERWDGLGYPDGLRGEAVPLASRIIAVADAIDAMLTERPYRKALSIDRTRDAIREGRGTQFDPAAADRAVALLSALEEEPAEVRARALAGGPPHA